MKIYTNDYHEIIGYEPEYVPSEYSHEYEVDAALLSGKSFPVVCGYKYEPQYDPDVDESGNLKYDENGNTTAHEHVLVERQMPMKCKAHECAAWAGGKCAYRGE